MTKEQAIAMLEAALEQAKKRVEELTKQVDINHAAYEESQGWVKKWAGDCGRLEAELAAMTLRVQAADRTANATLDALSAQLAEAKDAADGYSKGVYSATMLKYATAIGYSQADKLALNAANAALEQAEKRIAELEATIRKFAE